MTADNTALSWASHIYFQFLKPASSRILFRLNVNSKKELCFVICLFQFVTLVNTNQAQTVVSLMHRQQEALPFFKSDPGSTRLTGKAIVRNYGMQ